MEDQTIKTGEFLKTKITNLIGYFEHEFEDLKVAHFKEGFTKMKADLAATEDATVIGATLFAIRYLCPMGYLPLETEEQKEKSLKFLGSFIIAMRGHLEKKLSENMAATDIQKIWDFLDDRHYERMILYINCFSEILQPELYADAKRRMSE